MTIETIGRHLWQSTLFAAVVYLATLALRNNRASVRHALWLTASIKFLLPVAALVAVGQTIGLRDAAPAVRRTVTIVVETVGQPFTQVVLPPATPTLAGPWDAVSHALPTIGAAMWIAGSLCVVAAWWVRWRRVAAIAKAATPVHDGRALDALRRIEHAAGVRTPIALVASKAPLEPGVFGIRRPVLVWPAAIGDQLEEEQIATILTHEVSHVRRRDNLAAAAHMIVEALFWFHPLVWWIGARLLDERERACDEAVLGAGQPAEVYAESILKSCRLYLESPLPCVAGVTGSDLRKRIERIMHHRDALRLSAWKKAIVALVGIGPIAAPILVGAATPPRGRAGAAITGAHIARYVVAGPQGRAEFEVASVKPNKAPNKVMIQVLPGGRFVAAGVTLRQLIRNAYQLQDFQITGGPDWLSSDRFDVVAKADGAALDDPLQADKNGQPSRLQLMLRALLADRFKLALHTGTKEQPIFAMRLASREGAFGPQLKKSARDCDKGDAVAREKTDKAAFSLDAPPCGMRFMPGWISAGGIPMGQLANVLSGLVGRIVRDDTSLADQFEFMLRFTPDEIPQGFDKKASAIGLPPIDPNGASLFTALREQLGLKLDSERGPVDIVIIDRVERPTEN